MPHRSFLPRRRENASALVLAVIVVALLGILIGVAFDYTATTGIATRRGQSLTSAQAIANGSLEVAYKSWASYMAVRQSGTVGYYARTSDFNGSIDASGNPTGGLTLPLQKQLNTDIASTGFKVEKLTIQPVTRADVPPASGALTTSDGTVGPLKNTPGWVSTNYSFRARVTVTRVGDPTMSISVSRYFEQSDASLFQAMLFFQDDLELHPGPAMTLYGLVHTNSNMYLAAGSGGSLTFTSNVSYVGSSGTLKYNVANADYAKNNPAGYVEGTTARLYDQETSNWKKGTYKDPVFYDSTAAANVSRDARLSGVDALNPLGMNVTKAQNDNPGNPNATDTHEIIERPAPTGLDSKGNYNLNPTTAYTDPDAFASHRLYNTAGLRVLINHSKSFSTSTDNGATVVKAQVHVYAPVTPGSATSVEIPPTDRAKYPTAPDNITDSITKAIAVGGSGSGVFKDMREGRDITTNTVDMSLLTPALNGYATSKADYNGVFYIADITNADSSGNTGNSDAVRLKKGGVLPDLGLTVVTDGALYVQGDYNTGTTYGPTDLPNNGVVYVNQPDSNVKLDPTKFTTTNYTQKPAAVVGDAVMVLSNAWTDANDSLGLSDALRPKALPTTFNAALVSGAVITMDSAASGGAHNFPRFLEDWQSKTPFTYHGSMCELYQSDHFTGVYGQANVYSPPNRRWYFDDNFLTTPPPGNLRTTSYARGRWMRNTNLN